MKGNRRKHKRNFLNEVLCLNNLLINFMTYTSLKTKPLNSSYFRFHPFVFYFEKKKSLCLLRIKFQNLVVPEYYAHQIFTCALSPCYLYKEAVVQMSCECGDVYGGSRVNTVKLSRPPAVRRRTTTACLPKDNI